LGELLLEGERLGEVEAGLQEQDRHVGPDPSGHVDDRGPFGLECGCDGDARQARVLQSPSEDLLRMLVLEANVQIADEIFGKQQFHRVLAWISPWIGSRSVYPWVC